MKNILDTIFSRRSIRIYDRKKLDKETITDLLKAAMAAPSASNSRPWEFVVVTDDTKIKFLRSKLKYGNYNAPAIIIICGNTAIAQNESAYKFWVQDCSAATENLLVAAAGLGLGTCWVASYPKEDVMSLLRETLDIPEDVYPLNLIFVGYPAEEKAPRTQYDETRVHWESYKRN
ncbi:MAG: nitroreductase family protein [Anaerolineaceae bacterium]|jgi:nitroreductase|nr:nitroreductase family protein [Anaerolineaceae bacterium]